MASLGMYSGGNTAAEHAEQADACGGLEAYRVRMVNALLGIVQNEAMFADGQHLGAEVMEAAREQQLTSAGAGAAEDPDIRLGFLRWQILRATTPVRQLAGNPEAGPIPVAAAHAAEALQILLGVIVASHGAVAAGDVDTLAAQTTQLRAASAALDAAKANTEILLGMLGSVGR